MSKTARRLTAEQVPTAWDERADEPPLCRGHSGLAPMTALPTYGRRDAGTRRVRRSASDG